MSLVVFDFEFLEGKTVKELGVFKVGIVLGYSFLPLMTINLLFKQSGILKNYMGLIETMQNWNILCNIFTKYLCKDAENLDDLGCPKVSKLLNNSDTEWDCSNYLYRHKKTFHCAEKKAYAYLTWTLDFFDKV